MSSTSGAGEVERLNEFEKAEWRDIARFFRPDITDEQFEKDWAEFCEMKRKRSSH